MYFSYLLQWRHKNKNKIICKLCKYEIRLNLDEPVQYALQAHFPTCYANSSQATIEQAQVSMCQMGHIYPRNLVRFHVFCDFIFHHTNDRYIINQLQKYVLFLGTYNDFPTFFNLNVKLIKRNEQIGKFLGIQFHYHCIYIFQDIFSPVAQANRTPPLGGELPLRPGCKQELATETFKSENDFITDNSDRQVQTNQFFLGMDSSSRSQPSSSATSTATTTSSATPGDKSATATTSTSSTILNAMQRKLKCVNIGSRKRKSYLPSSKSVKDRIRKSPRFYRAPPTPPQPSPVPVPPSPPENALDLSHSVQPGSSDLNRKEVTSRKCFSPMLDTTQSFLSTPTHAHCSKEIRSSTSVNYVAPLVPNISPQPQESLQQLKPVLQPSSSSELANLSDVSSALVEPTPENLGFQQHQPYASKVQQVQNVQNAATTSIASRTHNYYSGFTHHYSSTASEASTTSEKQNWTPMPPTTQIPLPSFQQHLQQDQHQQQEQHQPQQSQYSSVDHVYAIPHMASTPQTIISFPQQQFRNISTTQRTPQNYATLTHDYSNSQHPSTAHTSSFPQDVQQQQQPQQQPPQQQPPPLYENINSSVPNQQHPTSYYAKSYNNVPYDSPATESTNSQGYVSMSSQQQSRFCPSFLCVSYAGHITRFALLVDNNTNSVSLIKDSNIMSIDGSLLYAGNLVLTPVGDPSGSHSTLLRLEN